MTIIIIRKTHSNIELFSKGNLTSLTLNVIDSLHRVLVDHFLSFSYCSLRIDKLEASNLCSYSFQREKHIFKKISYFKDKA